MGRATTILLLALLTTCLPASAQDSDSTRVRHSDYDMVMIHGLGSSSEIWNDVTNQLGLAFNIWAFEMPGHGRTQPVANASIDDFASLLGAFIDEHDIRNPVLVGHGMGGMIAMTYAFAHPAEVSRLVVIDTAPKQLATPEQKQMIALQLVENYDRFVAEYFLNMSPRENINQQVLDLALRTDKITFQQLLMSSFEFDLTEELSHQAIPILLIGSAMMFPDPAFARDMLDPMGFGKARSISFKTMPELGHFVMLEEPGYTASVIIAFAGLQR